MWSEGVRGSLDGEFVRMLGVWGAFDLGSEGWRFGRSSNAAPIQSLPRQVLDVRRSQFSSSFRRCERTQWGILIFFCCFRLRLRYGVGVFFFLSYVVYILQIVMLLLEHGADVNSRNYCGQVRRVVWFCLEVKCPWKCVFVEISDECLLWWLHLLKYLIWISLDCPYFFGDFWCENQWDLDFLH